MSFHNNKLTFNKQKQKKRSALECVYIVLECMYDFLHVTLWLKMVLLAGSLAVVREFPAHSLTTQAKGHTSLNMRRMYLYVVMYGPALPCKCTE